MGRKTFSLLLLLLILAAVLALPAQAKVTRYLTGNAADVVVPAGRARPTTSAAAAPTSTRPSSGSSTRCAAARAARPRSTS